MVDQTLSQSSSHSVTGVSASSISLVGSPGEPGVRVAAEVIQSVSDVSGSVVKREWMGGCSRR